MRFGPICWACPNGPLSRRGAHWSAIAAAAFRTARSSARADGSSGSTGCGAELLPVLEKEEEKKSSAPHGAELHPPLAAAERAALRSARSSARADGSSGSAGCGAELLPVLEKEEVK